MNMTIDNTGLIPYNNIWIRDSNSRGNHLSRDHSSRDSAPGELSEAEQKQVEELKTIDRKVRDHEMAHITAAGPYSLGGPVFQYQRGPDGVMYAVAGEVKLDTSEVPNDPEATIEKARTVERAALAPSDPSPQDRSVAARARAMRMNAELEKARQQAEEQKEDTEPEGWMINNALSRYRNSFNEAENILNLLI